jgi:uncharacterized protein (TIGR02266 family)
VPVRFRLGDEAAWSEAETRNIGVGGAFIATTRVAAVGTPLLLELELPGNPRRYQLTSLVRWSSDGPDPGMGVQFVHIDVDILLELNDFFAGL